MRVFGQSIRLTGLLAASALLCGPVYQPLAATPASSSLPLFFTRVSGNGGLGYFLHGKAIGGSFLPRSVVLGSAGHTVRWDFSQAQPDPEVEGIEPLSGGIHYLSGNHDTSAARQPFRQSGSALYTLESI
jgi:hypothetical protein